MVYGFLSVLHRLLRSPLIDVAYFAAGIVAHLASSEPQLWPSEAIARDTMLHELVSFVNKNSKYFTEIDFASSGIGRVELEQSGE